MKNTERKSTLLLLCTLTLTACGGGGGGNTGSAEPSAMGSAEPPATNLSDISWPVDAALTRRIVAGSMEPAHTLAEARQEIAAIETMANSLITSDILAVVPSVDIIVKNRVQCSGVTCRWSLPDPAGGVLNFSFSLSDSTPADESEDQLVMVHNGINIGQSRSRSRPGTANQVETHVYGGWLQYSSFETGDLYYPEQTNYVLRYRLAASYGSITGTNPVPAAGENTATWTGAVIGEDYSRGAFGPSPTVHGSSRVEVDFSTSRVDIGFDSLVDLENPGRSIQDMQWTLPLSRGTFGRRVSENDLIQGQFYGPNHEEVGGIFDRNNIVGAFGAIRDPQ